VTRDVRLEGYKALLVQLKQQQQQQAIQREAKRGLASDGR
jgi:pyruvate-formate lyase